VTTSPSLRERIAAFRPSTLTRGTPTAPLMILFGLNAVDELDQEAANVLIPEVRETFGLDIQGALTVTSLVGFILIFAVIPIAHLADRRNRTNMAAGGAAAWGVFAFATGLAPNVFFYAGARAGSALGRIFSTGTHPSLLSDYYPVDARAGVFALHRSASQVGQFVGPLAAGLIAYWLGWRWSFFLLAIPTYILVLFALRLREPVRGAQERRLMSTDEETIMTEEAPASLAEAWRIVWQVRTIRRVCVAIPFITIPAVALAPLLQLFYEQELGLNSAQRGFLAAVTEPFQFIGLFLGIPLAARMMRRDPGRITLYLAGAAALQVVALVLLVLTRNLPVVVVTRAVLALATSTTLPVLTAALSLITPPRVRSVGFSIIPLFIVPALLVQPIIGGLADEWGLPTGILALAPLIMVGAIILASSGGHIASDIDRVRTTTVTMAEVRASRLRGESKLLVVRHLDVHYGSVQVLFDVDFEVDEGEIVALLGTNGAGKSTLLRSISGLVEPSAGAIVYDGVDMTHTPPDEIVGRGVVQVPGGKGVFPTLTVADNLRLAGWPYQDDQEYLHEATEAVLGYFPILRERWRDEAGNLSGGEQQMLTLGMAFIAKPRLLMIDELSLGLAPIVVERLLTIVEAIRARGTTIILVEQSVNVALTLAEEAYFMEKGEIRFHGPTRDLLDRPDVLRSVFLEGAMALTSGDGGEDDGGEDHGVEDDGGEDHGVESHGVDRDERVATGADHVAAGWAVEGREVEGREVEGREVVGATVGGGNGRDVADGLDGGGDGNGDGDGDGALVVAGVGGDPDEVVLEAAHLTRSYGGVRAVSDVSFSLRRGEILGIIGPNGAGKTTLFDLLSGYMPPDHGRLEFLGADVTRMSADARARRGLGRSFQDARLFPGLSVSETIALALERHVEVRDPFATAVGLPMVRESELAVSARVDELIELVGLQAYRSKFVRELSTGTRRIVDLCCLLAHEPDVMLFDEPSSGIAQREAEALGPMLLRIREATGASLVVIEHDMPLVRSVSDSIMALDLGCVVLRDAPDVVMHDPRVVASYLGTNDATTTRSGTAGLLAEAVAHADASPPDVPRQ
jgi:ABC-type branched-subunit amino acid transport system ATPase component/MFS family permease